MASKEAKKRKREEYEMQLFGFHSRAFCAASKNIIYHQINSRCKTMCKTLERKFKLDAEGQSTLQADTDRLIKAYMRGARPHLQSLEDNVNKVIAIPSNVLLDEDKGQINQYTEEEVAKMSEHLENLQNRAKRAAMLNASLKQELEDLDRFKICEVTVNRLCGVIEESLRYPVPCAKMFKYMHESESLHKKLKTLEAWSEKQTYNPPFIDPKLKRIDLNCL